MRTGAIKADYPVCNMADTALEAPSSEALKHSFAFSSCFYGIATADTAAKGVCPLWDT